MECNFVGWLKNTADKEFHKRKTVPKVIARLIRSGVSLQNPESTVIFIFIFHIYRFWIFLAASITCLYRSLSRVAVRKRLTHTTRMSRFRLSTESAGSALSCFLVPFVLVKVNFLTELVSWYIHNVSTIQSYQLWYFLEYRFLCIECTVRSDILHIFHFHKFVRKLSAVFFFQRLLYVYLWPV